MIVCSETNIFLYYIKASGKCQVQCQSLCLVSLCPGFGREGIQIDRRSMTSWYLFISVLLYNSKLEQHMWSLFPFQMCQGRNVVQCNPRIPRQRIEDFEFETRMNYIILQRRKETSHMHTKKAQTYPGIFKYMEVYYSITMCAKDVSDQI